MINEILDLSKIEAGRMEVNAVDFSLATLADGLAATFRPLCAQKRIGFRLELESSAETRVKGDDGKLRQVLINLIGNAVKFTNSGEVFVYFKPEAEDRWLFESGGYGLRNSRGGTGEYIQTVSPGKWRATSGRHRLGVGHCSTTGGTAGRPIEIAVRARRGVTVPLSNTIGERARGGGRTSGPADQTARVRLFRSRLGGG